MKARFIHANTGVRTYLRFGVSAEVHVSSASQYRIAVTGLHKNSRNSQVKKETVIRPTVMKLLLLGATGPTGQLLVSEALSQGHEVVALVRNPDKLSNQSDKLKVVNGNIFETSELSEHMKGCDAVLSALGGRGGLYTPCDVYTKSGNAIVAAMREVGLKRFVAVTAWGTKDDPGLPFVWRWVLKPTFLKNLVRDMELFEDFLSSECSDINYTIVRPPRLTNDPSTGAKILTHIGQFVPGAHNATCRQDVARFMLQCLNTQDYDRAMVAIASSKVP